MTWTHDPHHETHLQAHRLKLILRDVPGVLADLEPTPRPGGGRSSSEPKLPISEPVMAAKDALRAMLVSWAKLVSEDFGIDLDFMDTSEQIAQWLTVHRLQLASHPASDDAEEELRGAVDGCRRLADRPARQIVGPCNECGTLLYANDDALAVQCPTCRQQADVTALREESLEFVRDRFFPAADLARILTIQGRPIKAGRIRLWGHRGKLGGYCRIDTRSAFYRAGDVIDMLTDREVAEVA